MERLKIFIAAGIFILLTAIKMLMPGAAHAIKAEAMGLIDRDTDYTAVFRRINETLSLLERTPEPENAAAQAEDTQDYAPVFAPVSVDDLRREMNSLSRVPAPESMTYAEDEPAQEDDEELSEAEETFLRSQEEYADYAVPANVTYSEPDFPYEYVSPVSGSGSSGFGYRMHPIANEVKFHYGTDIAAWSGTEIHAFADGSVTFAGYSDSYGNYITIDHGGGWQSLYAHCSVLYAQTGDEISAGDMIALVGDTGQTTGPHLHFELTCGGIYVNPEYYINNI